MKYLIYFLLSFQSRSMFVGLETNYFGVFFKRKIIKNEIMKFDSELNRLCNGL